MDNIDKIFSDSAFDCLDEGVKNNLKKLYINIDGKSTEQMLPFIMQFANTLPKGINLTSEQKSTIINAVTAQMNENDRKKLLAILNLFGLK